MRVYIINGCVTRNNIDERSHRRYFVGYAATTGVIIYWKTDKPFVVRIVHNILFGTYNYCLSIEDKHTSGSLLLQKQPEIIHHNSNLLNLIPCELDITSTTFLDTTILTYEIELPTY